MNTIKLRAMSLRVLEKCCFPKDVLEFYFFQLFCMNTIKLRAMFPAVPCSLCRRRPPWGSPASDRGPRSASRLHSCAVRGDRAKTLTSVATYCSNRSKRCDRCRKGRYSTRVQCRAFGWRSWRGRSSFSARSSRGECVLKDCGLITEYCRDKILQR